MTEQFLKGQLRYRHEAPSGLIDKVTGAKLYISAGRAVLEIFDGAKFVDYDSQEGVDVRNTVLREIHQALSIKRSWANV